jgi:hypothetical protein
MRSKLGILLMEEENGQIAVQLFADPDAAGESFDNLKGKINQKPQRATYVKLDYDKATVMSVSKNLPVPEVPVEDRPDAWRLGEGPIKIEEVKNESGNG